MDRHHQGQKEPSLADLEAFERLLRESLAHPVAEVVAPAQPLPASVEPARSQAVDPSAMAGRLSAQATLAELTRLVEQPVPFDHTPSAAVSGAVHGSLGRDWHPVEHVSAMPSAHSAPQSRGAAPASLAMEARPAGAIPASDDALRLFEEELQRFDQTRSGHAAPAAPPARPLAHPEPEYDIVTAPAAYREAYAPLAVPPPPGAPALRNGAGSHGLEQAESRLAAAAASVASLTHQGQPGRSRKVFLALGGLAVAGLAVIGGLFAFGGAQKADPNKAVPVITASKQPTKEKPSDPGGVDIPDQNKQILSTKTISDAKQGQIVSNTEQPMDLTQVTKQNPVRVVAPSPFQNAPGAVDAATPTANPLEPRRVTSVKIPTNDGPPAPATANQAPNAAAAPPLPSPPSRPIAAPTVTSSTTSAVIPPPGNAADPVKVQSRPVTATPPKTTASAGATPTATPPAPRAANAPLALAPPTAPANPRPPAVAAAPSTAGSGYAVQLASRPTEDDARAASAQLKARYAAAIGSKSPSVVSGEANGKTVYRVRVSGYSQAEATTACDKIKAAGGSCFVTRQ